MKKRTRENYGKENSIIGCGSMGKMLLEKIINSKNNTRRQFIRSNRTLEKIQVLKEKYKNMHILQNKQKKQQEIQNIIFICVRPSDIKDRSAGNKRCA